MVPQGSGPSRGWLCFLEVRVAFERCCLLKGSSLRGVLPQRGGQLDDFSEG